ncbi:MAG: single-stranded-DNA-specific exonuclease RecJ [Blautia sp.]|nr:single-stranded-DNA-specific exonuclease RecJ [Blautia sp.]
MEKWVVSAKKADFNGIAQRYGIDPLIARLIRNRDITEDEEIRRYLFATRKDIPDHRLLKDVDKAAVILAKKIREGKKIRVIGDYDIDGVTATYILIRGFRRAGANADTYIPDRVADGYGIHEHLILRAYEEQVDTIVTCDNGIAASEEIRLAKEKGMTVIVTDHHEIPFTEEEDGRSYHLPPADAIVNPKQPDCAYPNKNICGAVVALKLVTALYIQMGIPAEELEEFDEFAAIATVGDVMELRGENRILVREGLKKIPHTANTGLRMLVQACGLENRKLTAYHIGFVIGPCINASGRLETAAKSLALFMEKDSEKAQRLAENLRSLNEERKSMTEQGVKEAVAMIDSTSLSSDRVLVVFLPDVHESIAGIIAGRLRERYYKPVFVITRGEKSLKGSGRSIEAYSMYEEINKAGDLLIQYGGHPMAAGLSIGEENLDEFRTRLNANCSLTEEDLSEKVVIDAAMPFSYIRPDLVRQLELLEPFGKGNEKPLFAVKNAIASSVRVIGKNRNVVKMNLRQPDGITMEALYFGDAEGFLADLAQKGSVISATYYPEINEYRGVQNLQVVLRNYQ